MAQIYFWYAFSRCIHIPGVPRSYSITKCLYFVRLSQRADDFSSNNNTKNVRLSVSYFLSRYKQWVLFIFWQKCDFIGEKHWARFWIPHKFRTQSGPSHQRAVFEDAVLDNANILSPYEKSSALSSTSWAQIRWPHKRGTTICNITVLSVNKIPHCSVRIKWTEVRRGCFLCVGGLFTDKYGITNFTMEKQMS